MELSVDLAAVVQDYRERLDAVTYENALLKVALRQAQDALAEGRSSAASSTD